MKIRQLWISLFVGFVAFLSFNSSLLAVSYKIDQVNIDYIIQSDGTAEVKESYRYQFSGSHKGLIYQLDPTHLYQEPENVRFKVNQTEVKEADSKATGSYTKENSQGMWRYKIFYPGKNDQVTLLVTYRLPYLITSYRDTAELNRRLIGSQWENSLQNITATIKLPQAVTEDDLDKFRVFGHGDPNGRIKRGKDRQTVIMTLPHNPKGQFLEAHVLFPTYLVPQNKNIKDQDKFHQILKAEKALVEADKRAAQKRQRFLQKLKQISQILIAGLSFLVLPAFAFLAWLRNYRRHALKDFPHIPQHLFEPPSDLNPISLGVGLYDMPLDGNLLSSVVLNLVRKNWMSMESYTPKGAKRSKKAGKEFRMNLLKRPNSSEKLPAVEQAVLNLLFQKIGKEHTVTTANIKHYARQKARSYLNQLDQIAEKADKEMQELDYVRSASDQAERGILLFKILSGILLIVEVLYLIFYTIASNTFFTKIHLSLFILSLLQLIFLFLPLSQHLTAKGKYEKNKWQAFQQMLKDIAHLDRAKHQSLIIWEQYLVYALVLGQAKQVAKELSHVFPEDVLAESNLAVVTTNPSVDYILFNQSINKGYHTAQSVVSSSDNYSGDNSSGFGGGFSSGSSFGSGGGGGGGAF
ncbi:DUF2207 domain-containing protein [Atopobacter sp. AH10]|uniref:DUF2207 domain-containing protein n=1 Tax=Atopobacter sp. AH10 TaxID=2315861 RepID=UPI000EF21729|nr:DUF2207 domain-containing protein [Atopobacter sp. AH10]RLK63496.1 DUF2207 domain-containing protein [Atopobacter sp. AH10]